MQQPHHSLTQAQFDAVCDLVYNAGAGVIAATTGTGKALRSGDTATLRAKLALFINQNGKPLLGTPKNYKIRRYTAETHPDEWALFIKYAVSAITAMSEVFHKLPRWGNSEFEDRVLELDQLINDRGFKVDVALAEAAIEAVEKHKTQLQEEAQRKYRGSLTGKDFLCHTNADSRIREDAA